jgi:hypothetical protein
MDELLAGLHRPPPEGRIVGIDVLSEAIRRNTDLVELIQMDGFGMSIAKDDVDAVVVPLQGNAVAQPGGIVDLPERPAIGPVGGINQHRVILDIVCGPINVRTGASVGKQQRPGW